MISPRQLKALARLLQEFNAKGFNYTDFDGTANKWPLLLRLLLAMGEEFPDRKEKVATLETLITSYRAKGGAAFSEVMREAVKITPGMFEGLYADAVDQIAFNLVERHASEVYDFSTTLLERLAWRERRFCRPTIAITGSPQRMAEMFAKKLNGVHFVVGVEYFTDKQGRYTGERDEDSAIRKHLIVNQLAAELGHNPLGAVAVWDSESDLPFLDHALWNFVMNPSSELTSHLRTVQSPGIVTIIRESNKADVHAYQIEGGREHEKSTGEILPHDMVATFPRLPGLLVD